MTRPLDVELYQDSAKIPTMYRNTGGQALILHEIAAALAGCHYVWLPFRADGMLENHLYSLGFQTHCSEDSDREATLAALPAGIDSVYFGTPTIVNNRALFRRSVRDWEWWTMEREREVARAICRTAEQLRFKRIVSGLGTGDIEVHDRIGDMGPNSSVVCWKRFRDEKGAGFDDFVLVRDLRP